MAPALKQIVRSSSNRLRRLHALWTLEGLGSLDAALARELMSDRIPAMRAQAIRASESLYKAGDSSLGADWRAVAEKDADTDVVIQAMLTLNHLKVPGAAEAVAAARTLAQGQRHRLGRRADRQRSGGSGGALGAMTPGRAHVDRARRAPIYAESCFACHGETGRGAPMPGGRGLRGTGARRVAARASVIATT